MRWNGAYELEAPTGRPVTELQTGHLLRQEYIALCMFEQGFEYIPGLWNINFEYNDWSALPAPEFDAWALQFAEREANR